MNRNLLSGALCLGLALPVASGCNNDVTYVNGGSGGSGGSGAGTTSTGTAGQGAGQGGEGAADGCAAYDDAPAGSLVTVRFINNSGWPIYLPADCLGIQFELVRANADGVTIYGSEPFCLQTCEGLQSAGPMSCPECGGISSYLLSPGASADVPWNGTGRRLADMPETCYAFPGTAGPCEQRVSAAPDVYRISAVGYSSCGNGNCACTTDEGFCNGEPSGTEAYADPAQITYPGGDLVEVVFGPCAFPCPSSGS
jgi:hypothetical protein